MHISEGVLSAPVLTTGAVVALGMVGIGLKKMDYNTVPKVAILSSAFFVASLIHVPLGPTSTHLVLNGLLGLIIGWGAAPAIMVALTLQAILFQFGGVTTLGVNVVNMVLPALICFYLFGHLVRHGSDLIALMAASASGVLGVLLSAILVAICLVFTGESFIPMAKLVIVAHIPVMVIEGILTGFCVSFLKKLRPEILGAKCEKT